jgi:mannose-1-phosphate guanylyltransferase / phosphomannomutase
MRAVVMAGGEGTRLRPITANQPKPLLPIAGRPILEHVLRLLRRHGLTETVVTVQFLAALVRNYFGDGDDLGMHLEYATEETPLGTAGSVRNAAEALSDEPFVVISGDALTDIDLSDLIKFHQSHGALVTVALKAVPDPLEFGMVIADEDGRIERFLEKPTWGQVFSDTVNTGIYVMERAALDRVAPHQAVDWSADVFPELLADGSPLYGYVASGYWEDIGTLESYAKAQGDVLNRHVDVDIPGFELHPGIWVGEGSDIDAEAVLKGPLHIGDYTKVDAHAELREYTVLGSNVVVKGGAFLHRAVVHDNVYIGPQAHLRGVVVGKNSDIMRAARLEEGSVLGEECVVEEEAYVSSGVKVYPFKTIEAGAVVNTSVIWESRGHRTWFGPRGVCGLVNVEITPELVVRLASAYATTLPKGCVVTVGTDGSRSARSLKRAAVSALTAGAINVRDLEIVPIPVTRFEAGRSDALGGLSIRTSANDSQSVDIVFLDERGADLSPTAQRKVERVLSRQEFRRAFPGEIADLFTPARVIENYAQELLRCIDTTGVPEAGLKVVLDCAGGTAGLVLPTLLGRLGVEALTVNNRVDDGSSAETLADHMRDLDRLGDLVASSRAAFGVRFDPVGERISLVDEHGDLVHDNRALLVLVDLVCSERRGVMVALPVTTTRVAERVTRFHASVIRWTSTSPDRLTAAAADPAVGFAGDGHGGFLVPEFGPVIDGLAAFVRLTGLVARTRLTLSQIDARIPQAHVVQRAVPTPWAVKGRVMRAVAEAASGLQVETTDGLRIVEDDRWTLVLPDPAAATTHLWAEAPNPGAAAGLLERWAAVVERTGSWGGVP